MDELLAGEGGEGRIRIGRDHDPAASIAVNGLSVGGALLGGNSCRRGVKHGIDKERSERRSTYLIDMVGDGRLLFKSIVPRQ